LLLFAKLFLKHVSTDSELTCRKEANSRYSWWHGDDYVSAAVAMTAVHMAARH